MWISIIIPTFNRASVLSKALKSIHDQKSNVNFEVIIVDNGSTDNTKEVCDSWSTQIANFKYICDSIPGLLTGRHRGAKESKGEVLCFLDDDVELSETWLKSVYETMSARPDIALMTGPNFPRYGTEPPYWLSYFWNKTPFGGSECSFLSLLDLGDKIVEIDPTYVWGLNFTIRKSVFMELGGFHPDCIPEHLQILQGDGETGIALKANDKNYKALYHPGASLFHYVPALRLTHKYFEKRFYYQGVCDSFTMIRSENGLYNNSHQGQKVKNYIPYKSLLRYIKGKLHNTVILKIEDPIEIKVLREQFMEKYHQGFEFHQKAFRENSVIRDWVLRQNYFDYNLPLSGW